MPTKEEVAAVLEGLRIVDYHDNDELHRLTRRDVSCSSLASTIVSNDSSASMKDGLLADYISSSTKNDVFYEDSSDVYGELEVAASDSFDVDILEEHEQQQEGTPSALKPVQVEAAMQSESKSKETITPNMSTGLQQQQQQASTINFHQPRPFLEKGRINRSAKLSNACYDDMAEGRKQLHGSNTTSTSCNAERIAPQNGNKRNNVNNVFMAFFQNMKQRQQEQALRRQRQCREHGKKTWNEQDRQTDDGNNHFSSRQTYTEADNYNPDQDTDTMSNTTSSSSEGEESQANTNTLRRSSSLLQKIVDDFTPKGDQKILRAIGRTATVNAVVLVTAATGGAAGAIGYATGGAITTKRLYDGLVAQDEKEVTKSLAVYGAATGASIAGQAIAGALMIGVAGASLPLAGAVAFGVGCCSGVSAGALSEWGVDKCMTSDENKNVGEKLFLRRDCLRSEVLCH